LAESDTVPHWDERQAPSLTNSGLLALIGGFLDGFTYVSHGHVFANAMTGNVVLLGIYAAARSWHQSLRHLPPIITFLFGICAARALLLARERKVLQYPYLSVVITELVVCGIVALLPQHTPDIWITTSIAFAASMQVETFRVVNGRSFNSTFTTGNLRSLSEGLFDWIFRHNKDDARAKSGDFAVICSTFLAGATIGGSAAALWGNRALGIDFILLSILILRLWPRSPRFAA
jgi:uncharacterized membrane protein YoaK (UPF0700 family)